MRTRSPLVGMRKIMAEHMYRSLQVSAQVSVSGIVDMTEMVKIRQTILSQEKVLGFHVTYTDIFVKVLAQALKYHPVLNSSLIDDELFIWDDINIGVAVDLELEGGESALLVPVVRDADKLSLAETHQALSDFVERARNRKLLPDDYTGGTFTLTSVGVFGTSSGVGTPIINQPEVGIIVMRAIVDRPVVHEGQIVIRPIMEYSLTYDHRVVTGGDAHRFRLTLERLIQNPYLMLLH